MKKKILPLIIISSALLLVACQGEVGGIESDKIIINENNTHLVKPPTEVIDVPDLVQPTKELSQKEKESLEAKEAADIKKDFEAINKEIQLEKQEVEASKEFKATAYKSDENAEKVIPYEVVITGDKENAVNLLFKEINPYEGLELNGYKFNSIESNLELDFNDGIYQVQGSTGGLMFMGSVTETLFSFYPDLKRIKFIHNGKEDTILDHVLMNEYISRYDLKIK